MRNNAHSTQLHKPAKGLGRVFPGATGWIPLSLKSRLWNGPPTALLCTALKGGKQRGKSEYLFTASLSTSFAKYTVCEMVIPLTHKGVISWNNFLCIMIWIDGIWTSGERSANLQRNLELCGGSKKMRGNSGALGWDAHDWEYHLCFCLGPNPWWLGGKKKKNPPAMWEMKVPSLGWEDALEEGMATHSSILAWEIPWTEEPGGLQSMGCKSRTWLSDKTTTTN